MMRCVGKFREIRARENKHTVGCQKLLLKLVIVIKAERRMMFGSFLFG